MLIFLDFGFLPSFLEVLRRQPTHRGAAVVPAPSGSAEELAGPDPEKRFGTRPSRTREEAGTRTQSGVSVKASRCDPMDSRFRLSAERHLQRIQQNRFRTEQKDPSPEPVNTSSISPDWRDESRQVGRRFWMNPDQEIMRREAEDASG